MKRSSNLCTQVVSPSSQIDISHNSSRVKNSSTLETSDNTGDIHVHGQMQKSILYYIILQCFTHAHLFTAGKWTLKNNIIGITPIFETEDQSFWLYYYQLTPLPLCLPIRTHRDCCCHGNVVVTWTTDSKAVASLGNYRCAPCAKSTCIETETQRRIKYALFLDIEDHWLPINERPGQWIWQ